MQTFTEIKICAEFPAYGVTPDGGVISLKSGKHLVPSLVNGYPRVSLCKDGKIKNIHVHRLVASLFCVKPEGCTVVNHKDLDRTNNKASNLEWCTQSHNVSHAYDNEAAAYGENSHMATISMAMARSIAYAIRQSGWVRGSAQRISRNLGVSVDIVRQIHSRTCWVRDTADILD